MKPFFPKSFAKLFHKFPLNMTRAAAENLELGVVTTAVGARNTRSAKTGCWNQPGKISAKNSTEQHETNPDCPDLFLAESTALVDLCGEWVGKYTIVTWINMSNVKQTLVTFQWILVD